MPSNFGTTETIHITFFHPKHIKNENKNPQKDILTRKTR